MPNQVIVLDDEQMPQWDEFVSTHTLGSIYHTSAWRAVVRDTYSIRPFYFALIDERGRILAGLPLFEIRSSLNRNRISTLPCAQSCDPLVSNVEQYLELKGKIISFAKNRALRAWELKTSDIFSYETSSRNISKGAYFTHVLELDKPADVLFAKFHKSMLQRAIKKASRIGMSVLRCGTLEDVHQFYDLYLQMRREKGLLPQPRAFFENIWKAMSEEKRIEILFAQYRGMIISTLMLLKFGDKVTYEYAATRTGTHRFSPSPFLLWEAIRQAKAEGFRYFDFGRTASTEATLSAFKKRWGGTLRPFYYYNILDCSNPTALRQNRMMKALMDFSIRLLPLSICEYAGRLLYKHIL
jgi:CelD/BcsL family acetyltransferase involved in cellulose biosynthesis